MSEIRVDFKFEIGDLVVHVSATKGRERRFVVLERLAQECTSGVQRHYMIRAGGNILYDPVVSGSCQVHEIELLPAPPDAP